MEQALSAEDHVFVGIHVPSRLTLAPAVQTVLSKYGDCIRTRLGVSDLVHGSGVLLVEMFGDPARYQTALVAELHALGAETAVMSFKH